MKTKTLFTLLMVIAIYNSQAQDLKTFELEYVEVVAIQKKIQEYYLLIDHGQGINYKKGVILKDESGNDKAFTGVTQILNYMDKHGWKYVDLYNENNGGMIIKRYIFKRKEE